MKILAIESSCDETSAAVFENDRLLSHLIATQEIHSNFGGVVPEIASRAHIQQIEAIVFKALKQAYVKPKDLTHIAFTEGPGLLGALLVGHSFAKGMAAALQVPLIGVHHMQAHILAHFIEEPKPNFPFLCLTVSGGHTQLILVKGPLDMKILGQTTDDAVGEAFDKSARLLGIPYPGGPLLDDWAEKGNPNAFKFKVPEMPNYDFSFSGIKTAFLYFAQEKGESFIKENLADIAASVRHTLVAMLMKKVRKAIDQTGINRIAIAGGVSANKGLRKILKEEGDEKGWEVFIPAFNFCTDNAAMIGITAYYQALATDFRSLDCSPQPRLPFPEPIQIAFL